MHCLLRPYVPECSKILAETKFAEIQSVLDLIIVNVSEHLLVKKLYLYLINNYTSQKEYLNL